MTFVLGGYLFDARKWFTGPTINLSQEELDHTQLEKDKQEFQAHDDIEDKPNDKVQVSEVETA